MSIKAYWDDVDPTIMRIDYEGEWTLQDQEELSKLSSAMLGDETRRNDVIVYVHENTHFPRLVSPKLVHTVVEGIATNPGVRVFVGAPVIMQTVLDMFSGLVGGKMGVEIETAKTVDSARSLIRRKRTEQGQ
jgi:hypothetical protein